MPFTQLETELIELIKSIRAGSQLAESSASLPCFKNVDWPMLVKTAEHHGLAPLAYEALKRSGLLKDAPESAATSLRMAYLRASVANRLAFQDLASLIDRLKSDDIPVIVLKGGSLAATLYDDAALRPMGDLDLLIPRDAVERAKRALAEQGYRPSTEMADGFADRFSVEQTFLRMGNRPSQIDVHWHAFTMPYYFERIPVEWFWERALEIDIGRASALMLDPTAQLIYLSVHYMLHNYRRLIWSHDIALLIKRCGEQIDWDRVVEAAGEFRLSAVLADALYEVREQWGVPVPASVDDRLRGVGATARQRIILAATSRMPGSDAGLLYGAGFLGARRKMAYWLRVTFPSAGYMRTRFQVRNDALIPFCYLLRLTKGAYLCGRAGYFMTRASISSRLFRRTI
jgi:hypothetical protein